MEMKFLKEIKSLFIIFLFTGCILLQSGCTTLSFKSYGQFHVNVGPRSFHGDIETYEGERDFYLWGIIPYEHKIYVDDLMKEYDYISVANIEIEEYQTFFNSVLSYLSLGLYVPRNFRVKFYGKK